ncbi:MAG: aldo/keto reductase [Bacteroidetes bacterium QH_2_64_74]|nr:MAG: aldo/keto reductase [Bacteroidetes bacterium QH_2_64_74]
MASIPTRTLPSGDALPVVGFGTWNQTDEEVQAALPVALDHGYTHVDTAEGYQNEDAIGNVLAGYDREELFLTSKVLPSDLHYEGVLRSLSASLKALGVDALDLYLIHWPNPAISLRETLQALDRAHADGMVRNVGVSNFTAYHLKFAQKIAGVPIAVNQIEYHPWYARPDLLRYCQEHDIVVEAAAPLARGAVLDDPVITELADTHGVMPAQVVLRWAVEQGIVVLPQSTTPDHIRANLDLFDWSLDPEAVDRLDDLDRGENVYDLDLDDPIYGIPA